MFRHRDFPWISNFGEPFSNFTYDACFRIPQELDFKKRVIQEDATIVKRDVRGTGFGRRLGYLSIHELFAHSKKYRATKFVFWYQKGRVVEDV